MILCERPTGKYPCFLNGHPLFVPYPHKHCNVQCKLSSFVCVNPISLQYILDKYQCLKTPPHHRPQDHTSSHLCPQSHLS